MRGAAVRWWLLKRAAQLCRLSVAMRGDRLVPNAIDHPDHLPVFVVFSRDLAATAEAIDVLRHRFNQPDPRQDARLHTEWTH